jgi:hypothetical protein
MKYILQLNNKDDISEINQIDNLNNPYAIKLNSNIDLSKIKEVIKKRIKYKSIHKKYFDEDQEIVYTILHKFSNYESLVWSMYRDLDKKFIHKQLKLVLLEVSRLDTSLTWACIQILKRYKKEFYIRKKRSSYLEKNFNSTDAFHVS